ncbi:MAG: Fic family protein [Eubacterium sp.]|nr:Fic family protein [Eubacterium sp.]
MASTVSRNLIETLVFEKKNNISGGIYNKIQVDFAYNSNHIEGSRLTHDQTKYIYETNTVAIAPARITDIFETVNHFRCFDYVLDTIDDTITNDYIKKLHYILKNNTISADNDEAVVGDFKKYPNYVGDIETAAPKDVPEQINELLETYNAIEKASFYDILDFHARFEKIHPFYDGNGRVGRLLMFKECLKNDIVPFIIEDLHKAFYYRGLQEWQNGGEKGYLIDTCLMMQDDMKIMLDYFEIDYDKTIIRSRDVLKDK